MQKLTYTKAVPNPAHSLWKFWTPAYLIEEYYLKAGEDGFIIAVKKDHKHLFENEISPNGILYAKCDCGEVSGSKYI